MVICLTTTTTTILCRATHIDIIGYHRQMESTVTGDPRQCEKILYTFARGRARFSNCAAADCFGEKIYGLKCNELKMSIKCT